MEVPNMPPSSGVPPKHLYRQLQRGHRDDREGRVARAKDAEWCPHAPLPPRPTLLSPPVPAHPAPSRKKEKHPTKAEAGETKRRRARGVQNNAEGSPAKLPWTTQKGGPAGCPGNRRRAPAPGTAALRPRRPGGVTGTRSGTGGQDGAARIGAERPPERARAARRRDSPAFWSRGQR